MTKHIDASRKNVRKFGILFAVICVLLTAYLLYRESVAWPWSLGGGAFFLLAAFFGYPVLRPVYIVWMTIAFILAWINTRLLLGLFFYLVITPVGVMMRLFGKDFLDKKITRAATTYWIRRERQPFDPERYQRLF